MFMTVIHDVCLCLQYFHIRFTRNEFELGNCQGSQDHNEIVNKIVNVRNASKLENTNSTDQISDSDRPSKSKCIFFMIIPH